MNGILNEPKQVKVDAELWAAVRNRIEVHDDWGAEFKFGSGSVMASEVYQVGEGGMVTLHPSASESAEWVHPEAVAEISEAFKAFVGSESWNKTIGFLNQAGIDYAGELSEREWSDMEIFNFYMEHKVEIEG